MFSGRWKDEDMLKRDPILFMLMTRFLETKQVPDFKELESQFKEEMEYWGIDLPSSFEVQIEKI